MTIAMHGNRLPHSPDSILRTYLPTVRRGGYDPAAVNAFRETLAADMAHLLNQVNAQAAEIERLKRYYQGQAHTDLERTRRRADAEVIAMSVRAQAEADQLLAAAQQQGRAIIMTAEKQANSLIDRARMAADAAAWEYRTSAGAGYQPDREQLARQAAMFSTLVSALDAAAANLTACAAQVSGTASAVRHSATEALEATATSFG